jgi:HPt (histidine-containing phosphotransfer) domain-containing protein
MNALLEQALRSVAALPDEAQETIASLILEEIEAERGWNARFAASQDALGELVRRARADVAENDSLPYDPSDRPEA